MTKQVTKSQKIRQLISRSRAGKSDFAPFHYGVLDYRTGKWNRKTKLVPTIEYANRICDRPRVEIVSCIPNPEYPGFGLNNYLVTYLEYEYKLPEFWSDYKAARKFVEENLDSLWKAYESYDYYYAPALDF